MTTLNNARLPRKSLANQLDRLDVILDGLADALNGSVEDAVRGVVAQAVREAVTATLQEVLNQPELLQAALARHAPAQAQPASPRRTLRDLLSAVGQAAVAGAATSVSRGLAWLSRRLREAHSWWASLAGEIGACLRLAAHFLAVAAGAAWSRRRVVTTALVAGLLSGAACYHAGPEVAGLVGGLYGSALAAGGGVWSSSARPAA